MMEKDPLKRYSASELLEEDIMAVSSRESSASSRQRNGLLSKPYSLVEKILILWS